jgi:hypothetical protein
MAIGMDNDRTESPSLRYRTIPHSRKPIPREYGGMSLPGRRCLPSFCARPDVSSQLPHIENP